MREHERAELTQLTKISDTVEMLQYEYLMHGRKSLFWLNNHLQKGQGATFLSILCSPAFTSPKERLHSDKM